MKDNDYKEIILNLITDGESLEDAAEKCGHDEELVDWRQSKRVALKALQISKEELKQWSHQKAVVQEMKAEAAWRSKQDKERAKHAAEDEAILRELGLR